MPHKRQKPPQIDVTWEDAEQMEAVQRDYVTLEGVRYSYALSRSQTYHTLRACQRYLLVVHGRTLTTKQVVVRWRDVRAAMSLRGRAGNYRFRDRDFQQEMALRRWYPDSSGTPTRRKEG